MYPFLEGVCPKDGGKPPTMQGGQCRREGEQLRWYGSGAEYEIDTSAERLLRACPSCSRTGENDDLARHRTLAPE